MASNQFKFTLLAVQQQERQGTGALNIKCPYTVLKIPHRVRCLTSHLTTKGQNRICEDTYFLARHTDL